MHNEPRRESVCDPRFWGGHASRSALREKNDRNDDNGRRNGRRADDRNEYADAYLRARGPQAALVKQWIDYLETGK